MDKVKTGAATETIEAFDLGKVKDLSKILIRQNSVLVQVIDPQGDDRRIIVDDPMFRPDSMYWEIIKIGDNVINYKVGDIVLDINRGGAAFYTKGKKRYLLIDAYNIALAVHADNYGDGD